MASNADSDSDSNKTRADLETIKGVGSSRAEYIRKKLGIEEIKELAQVSKEKLKKVPGIGEKRAKKILKNVDELVEECSHCGSPHYTDETCRECVQQLERRIERIKKRVKDEDIPQTQKKRFKDRLSEIKYKKEGELSSRFASLDSLENEVKESARKSKRKKMEKLTEIKGIGDSRAKKLKEELDISKTNDLIKMAKKDLTQVKGIGDKKAEKILESALDLFDECDRCGAKVQKGKPCIECSEKLDRILEGWKEEIEELDRSYGIRSRLEKKLEEIKACKEEGELSKAFELTEELEENIKDSENLKTLLSRIDTKMDENSEVIDFAIYNKEVERVQNLLKIGKYKRGVKKSEKILEHIDNEKRLGQMDKEELAQLGIEKFCRRISGPKSITGEKIYKSGYNTIRDVAKAGAARIEKDADIDTDMAEIIVKRIDDFLGKEEFEFKDEIEEELEELEEEVETGSAAEEIFREAEVIEEEEAAEVESAKEMFEELEEFEEKEGRKKRTEKIPKRKPKKKRKRPSPKKKSKKQIIKSTSRIEESETSEAEIDNIYWLPAVILPIIFLMLALFLFVF